MGELDDIVKEFLVESYENLDQLDRDLVAIEDSPNDRDLLSSVFRTIHTIKGTCGFLGFPILEHVTHVGENLLSKLRDGELQLNGPIANGLLGMVDAVRTILATIEFNGTEGDDHYESLIATLDQLRTASNAPAASVAVTANAPIGGGGIEEQILESMEDLSSLVEDLKQNPRPTKKTSRRTSAPGRRTPKSGTAKGNSASRPDHVSMAEPESGPTAQTVAGKTSASSAVDVTTDSALEATAIGEFAATRVAQQGLPNAGSVASAPEAQAEPGEKTQGLSESTVRLDVALLDRLMNLVGELVLTRNQILQFSQSLPDSGLADAAQRLNLITTELQEGVLKTRMQPIRNAWSKLPRVVRDLAQSCEKKVTVEMEGADTELDKTILEAIKDPLTHIVRNSVDHGIEPPDVRIARGKPAEGTLRLRAFHEGGQVNIEIADDGGGINLDRVRTKGIEQGLITPEQAQMMCDRDVMQLILLPGFSTAAKVTSVSGRGVGMDVVKTNVEKIGGTLDINSVAGEGTTLRIRIPLTLAIVPGLVVTCGGDRYCIPQVSLLELVRLDSDGTHGRIETMHSVPVYRLRDQLLPLIYLDEELGLRPRRNDAERRDAEIVNIVVLQAENRQFGLVVDRISDTQEIVVKPLGQHLKDLAVFAGSTIMGDGTVSLILDVAGIARQGHVLGTDRGRALQEAVQGKNDSVATNQEFLIVDPGDGSRAAIRLSTVARLEEIRPETVERCGSQVVTQYREKIMPLISLDGGFGGVCSDVGMISVVVYHGDHQDYGFMVGKILDIIDHAVCNPDSVSGGQQIMGGQVTRIIDLSRLICA